MAVFIILFVCFVSLLEKNSAIEENGHSVSFEWNIKMSRLKWVMQYQPFLSPTFTTHNKSVEIEWLLKFYPRGRGEIASLSLMYYGDKIVDQHYSMTLKNHQDPRRNIVRESRVTFDPFRKNSSGIIKFVKASVLNNSANGFMDEDDQITILVTLLSGPSTLGVQGPSTVSYFWEVMPDDIKPGPGVTVKSPEFSSWVGSQESKWQMILNLDQKSGTIKDYFSPYLCRLKRSEKQLTYYELSIINKNPRGIIHIPGHATILQGDCVPRVSEYVKIIDLLNTTKGFVIDGKIRLEAQIIADPTQIKFRHQMLPQKNCKVIDSTSAIEVTTTAPVVLKTNPPLEPPKPANSVPMNTNMQNIYRSIKIKIGEVEMTIDHTMSFESIENLIGALIKSTKSSTSG